MIDRDGWKRLPGIVRRFTTEFPNDVISVGRIAVNLHYLYRIECQTSKPDVAFYVSKSTWLAVRDVYGVAMKSDEHNHVVKIDGVDVDLYVAGIDDRILSFDEVAKQSTTACGVRVACPGHLLALKLDTLNPDTIQARATPHAHHDRCDVAKLLVMLSRDGVDLSVRYMTAEKIELCERVLESNAFFELDQSEHHAMGLRKLARHAIKRLKERVAG